VQKAVGNGNKAIATLFSLFEDCAQDQWARTDLKAAAYKISAPYGLRNGLSRPGKVFKIIIWVV
jgi:hypothetical protein